MPIFTSPQRLHGIQKKTFIWELIFYGTYGRPPSDNNSLGYFSLFRKHKKNGPLNKEYIYSKNDYSSHIFMTCSNNNGDHLSRGGQYHRDGFSNKNKDMNKCLQIIKNCILYIQHYKSREDA